MPELNELINALIFLLLAASVIILQIFLSKRESKWPGLVLPSLSFIAAILFILFMADSADSNKGSVLLTMLLNFLLLNIPTFILLAVYGICRTGNRRRQELDKMSVQELE